ncbi:alginate lyase family protein [uncultured Draconibacterium sp.]|uniref:alginate lyase family protein n=1 Tax=uncultured Draconibacterium sp. TaxID=1573823 RepID=UPI0025CF0168|nr:alginate lyase family protein [uncultured Draconibacterium sp.]
MKRRLTYSFLLFAVVLFSCQPKEVVQENTGFPKLILQKAAVPALVDGIEKYPMLQTSFAQAKETADKGIEAGITVPFPKDPGGGYTHEKHKLNYIEMYNAGVVYQLTGDEKYAVFVRDMLNEYATLYPTLGIHPMKKNQSPGKLFWQGLNESVWLVYTIQAYDCIYEFLSAEEQANIEENLFKKVVEFFTVEDKYSFDRVHNHGTWAVAGVGMTGMVLGDSLLVQKALYSTKLDGSGGFLKQIDELFSPDGYYAEGPYYQRYALMPFIVFAQALDNNLPELKIFEYKNGLLPKAVTTVLQLTIADGKFYPINDAIKEKSWMTPELIFGTDIVYKLTGNNKLLNVAEYHGKVMLSAEGLAVAKAIAEGKTERFERVPMLISDGANGDKGGLALLRMGDSENQTSVLFKFASQGMGHGHFDRLGISLYNKGEEIIPDYGAARFLNVAAKEGGRYLPENKTWAKHTIAHNALVLNEQSHFAGKLKAAEENDPVLVFADLENPAVQIVSATDENCYDGASLNRTVAMLQVEGRTYVIDLNNVKNESSAMLDLPVYFNGQILSANFDYTRLNQYKVLGTDQGYQHLIVDATAQNLPATASLTWMQGNGFYTVSTLADANTECFITRLGANDPDYNLRHQMGMVFRFPKAKNKKLLTVYEMHGDYNPASEAVLNSEGSVKSLQLIEGDDEKVAILLQLKNEKTIQLLLDLKFADSVTNTVQINGETLSWDKNYKVSIK